MNLLIVTDGRHAGTTARRPPARPRTSPSQLFAPGSGRVVDGGDGCRSADVVHRSVYTVVMDRLWIDVYRLAEKDMSFADDNPLRTTECRITTGRQSVANNRVSHHDGPTIRRKQQSVASRRADNPSRTTECRITTDWSDTCSR
ncbi:hypothetical protein EVAR_29610_1 [Eumeta japonica]|uniref:Uncharacterized protein n=1 Tax=Eumeta variegata TaxID=151549 RepID=A0A4C1VUF8_EUMVA|nr:hypothetical protein EVAR_29610_1 [Eumeta japonica]